MIELLIAFGAGLISFLSPCVLPLIPGYVSFVTGSSLNEILENKRINLLPLIIFSLYPWVKNSSKFIMALAMMASEAVLMSII